MIIPYCTSLVNQAKTTNGRDKQAAFVPRLKHESFLYSRRLYPIPLLICTDGTEYTFGFSCYKKIPSDFNSTPHSIRIRVYTGYNWRPWDATPEIAELEADGTLCFSLRDSNRERKTSRVILVSIGAAFTGIFALSAYDIFLSPTVQKKRQAKERAKRKAQKRDRSNRESAPKS